MTSLKKFKRREDLKLKTAYCQCPSYDLLIPASKDGMDRWVKTCKLTPGIPLKPMLAHPTKGVQEVHKIRQLRVYCEWKYDGERAQISSQGWNCQHISRNQETTHQLVPDIISRLPNCSVRAFKSAVLDCEAVAKGTAKPSRFSLSRFVHEKKKGCCGG